MYSHSLENQTQALDRMRGLLQNKVRYPLFDASQHMRKINDDGHLNVEFLEALYQVICVRDAIQSLDRFAKWSGLNNLNS